MISVAYGDVSGLIGLAARSLVLSPDLALLRHASTCRTCDRQVTCQCLGRERRRLTGLVRVGTRPAGARPFGANASRRSHSLAPLMAARAARALYNIVVRASTFHMVAWVATAGRLGVLGEVAR